MAIRVPGICHCESSSGPPAAWIAAVSGIFSSGGSFTRSKTSFKHAAASPATSSRANSGISLTSRQSRIRRARGRCFGELRSRCFSVRMIRSNSLHDSMKLFSVARGLDVSAGFTALGCWADTQDGRIAKCPNSRAATRIGQAIPPNSGGRLREEGVISIRSKKRPKGFCMLMVSPGEAEGGYRYYSQPSTESDPINALSGRSTPPLSRGNPLHFPSQQAPRALTYDGTQEAGKSCVYESLPSRQSG